MEVALKATVVLFASLSVSAAYSANIFAANAAMTFGPMTQIGTISTSTLVINNGPGSFTVSGYVDILVTPGVHAGTLLSFTVDRLLDPNYTPAVGTAYTVTSLNGFSQPPGFSTFTNTSGHSYTEFTNFPVISRSNIQMNLVNGVGAWNTTVTSPAFTYVTGGTQYVRQVFDLDGSINSMIGGTWKVDFPLTSEVVPEPMSYLPLSLGLAMLVRRKRKR